MEFKIKEELLQKLLNYLAGRPFIEVTQLINELQKVEKITPLKEEKKEDKKKNVV